MVNNLSANAGDTSDGFDLWVTQVPRSRKWQPTLVGWKIPWTKSLAGYSPWGFEDLKTTEQANIKSPLRAGSL